jgi:hypothetical protein
MLASKHSGLMSRLKSPLSLKLKGEYEEVVSRIMNEESLAIAHKFLKFYFYAQWGVSLD